MSDEKILLGEKLGRPGWSMRCEKLISRLRIVRRNVWWTGVPPGRCDDRRLGDNKIIICLTHCAYKQTYHYGACFSNLAGALKLFFILQLLQRLFWPSGRRVIWRVHISETLVSFLITRNQDKRLIIFPTDKFNFRLFARLVLHFLYFSVQKGRILWAVCKQRADG